MQRIFLTEEDDKELVRQIKHLTANVSNIDDSGHAYKDYFKVFAISQANSQMFDLAPITCEMIDGLNQKAKLVSHKMIEPGHNPTYGSAYVYSTKQEQ